jgi:hypothetical protein
MTCPNASDGTLTTWNVHTGPQCESAASNCSNCDAYVGKWAVSDVFYMGATFRFHAALLCAYLSRWWDEFGKLKQSTLALSELFSQISGIVQAWIPLQFNSWHNSQNWGRVGIALALMMSLHSAWGGAGWHPVSIRKAPKPSLCLFSSRKIISGYLFIRFETIPLPFFFLADVKPFRALLLFRTNSSVNMRRMAIMKELHFTLSV